MNGARCRRKDITQLFLGTGLGSRSYAIIEQGMISRVIEAQARGHARVRRGGRRHLTYKERRQETESASRHAREPRAPAGRARRRSTSRWSTCSGRRRTRATYKTLKAEQRRVDAELLALRLRWAARRSRDARAPCASASSRSRLRSRRSARPRRTIEKLRVELADRSERFNAVQGRYYKVGAEIARLEQAVQHRKELIQRQTEDLAGHRRADRRDSDAHRERRNRARAARRAARRARARSSTRHRPCSALAARARGCRASPRALARARATAR